MNTGSLIIASTLMMVPILISYKEKLGLEKEIVVSVLRAMIQLVIVGYILDVIFDLEKPIFTIILVGMMMMNAALNTKKRGAYIKGVVGISFCALFIGTGVTMTILILSGAIKGTPHEVIPVAGMIMSNAMIAIGLSYQNLTNAFHTRQAEVEVRLSLGADRRCASKEIIQESIKLSITPTIDSAKTLGIVSLPGMMTGLILGGVSPLIAIKFQIMVTFMILSSATIAAMVATYFGYRSFYNSRKQLEC